jgi:hypothetical protein
MFRTMVFALGFVAIFSVTGNPSESVVFSPHKISVRMADYGQSTIPQIIYEASPDLSKLQAGKGFQCKADSVSLRISRYAKGSLHVDFSSKDVRSSVAFEERPTSFVVMELESDPDSTEVHNWNLVVNFDVPPSKSRWVDQHLTCEIVELQYSM